MSYDVFNVQQLLKHWNKCIAKFSFAVKNIKFYNVQQNL